MIAPAHPRVGGENLSAVAALEEASGSSPRGRGKLIDCLSGHGCSRLIPAWAGKTARRHCARRRRSAHPRVGGENLNAVAGGNKETGSSPRGRGKPWSCRSRSASPSAHPRVGGENSVDSIPHAAGEGSSPRGRGKHPLGVAFRTHDGLIPAWAGKTLEDASDLIRHRAHPRVGGENQHVVARLSLTGRLIPAWAGKT